MSNFAPISAVAGGILIGLAAVLVMFGNGRITGISGIAVGLLATTAAERLWHGALVLGLVAAPWLFNRPTANIAVTSNGN